MTDKELAKQIGLTPNAVLFKGIIHEHKKSGMPSMTPHYAAFGNPPVTMNPEDLKPYGAQLEFQLMGVKGIYDEAFVGQTPKYFMQQIYGPRNLGPSIQEVRALHEASRILRGFVGREVYIVTMPILFSGQTTGGRLWPVAVFTLDGAPIYVEPRAADKGVFCSVPFPETQEIRTLRIVEAASAPAATQGAWFPALLKAAKGQGLEGAAAVKKALDLRVASLEEHGAETESARIAAYNDYAKSLEEMGVPPIPFPYKGAPAKKGASSSSAKTEVLKDLKSRKKRG
jgi:hypothetical protein